MRQLYKIGRSPVLVSGAFSGAPDSIEPYWPVDVFSANAALSLDERFWAK